MKRVVVIDSHGDDGCPIGAGARIMEHEENGDEVHLVCVTYGEAMSPKLGRSGNRLDQLSHTARRREEILSSANVVGISEDRVYFLQEEHERCTEFVPLPYPPHPEIGGFYPCRLNENVLFLELLRIFRRICGSQYYIPHDGEQHWDHRRVADIAKRAIRFAPGDFFAEVGVPADRFQVERVLAYEVDRSIKDPEPDVIMQATKFWNLKLEAIRKHSTQNVDVFIGRIEKRIDGYCKRNNGTFVGRHLEFFRDVTRDVFEKPEDI